MIFLFSRNYTCNNCNYISDNYYNNREVLLLLDYSPRPIFVLSSPDN